VKINVVIIKGFNDNEIPDFVKLAAKYPLHVRFIEFMPIGDLSFFHTDKCMSSIEILQRVEQCCELTIPPSLAGSGPAKYFGLAGGTGSMGLISPMTDHFCGHCNRIRLTADGRLRGCLHHRQEFDLKPALNNEDSNEQLVRLFEEAIQAKPQRHGMNDGWGIHNERRMVQIGG
jgi:cyclic pyranopterin phosphate synthase